VTDAAKDNQKTRGTGEMSNQEKIKENLDHVIHGQFVNVTGFLSGISFTALILLIQFSDRFLFSEWLITGTAIVGVFLILASIARIWFIDPANKLSDALIFLTGFVTLAGLFGLIAIIPFILWTVTPIGAIIVAVISALFTSLSFMLQ
jgi:hypothetical protein